MEDLNIPEVVKSGVVCSGILIPLIILLFLFFRGHGQSDYGSGTLRSHGSGGQPEHVTPAPLPPYSGSYTSLPAYNAPPALTAGERHQIAARLEEGARLAVLNSGSHARASLPSGQSSQGRPCLLVERSRPPAFGEFIEGQFDDAPTYSRPSGKGGDSGHTKH